MNGIFEFKLKYTFCQYKITGGDLCVLGISNMADTAVKS